MRERVLDAIYKKLDEDPENENLQRQITLLNMASICTIDSFCLDVVKNNFYELENVLSEKFVRISNSEIVNFSKVQSLDFKIIGTIVLKFYTDRYTYVSRRYVKKIKEYLNI